MRIFNASIPLRFKWRLSVKCPPFEFGMADYELSCLLSIFLRSKGHFKWCKLKKMHFQRSQLLYYNRYFHNVDDNRCLTVAFQFRDQCKRTHWNITYVRVDICDCAKLICIVHCVKIHTVHQQNNNKRKRYHFATHLLRTFECIKFNWISHFQLIKRK